MMHGWVWNLCFLQCIIKPAIVVCKMNNNTNTTNLNRVVRSVFCLTTSIALFDIYCQFSIILDHKSAWYFIHYLIYKISVRYTNIQEWWCNLKQENWICTQFFEIQIVSFHYFCSFLMNKTYLGHNYMTNLWFLQLHCDKYQ